MGLVQQIYYEGRVWVIIKQTPEGGMSEELESHIKERFEIIRKIGSGAYGHVWKAKDRQTDEIVALKKIFDAFQHSTDAQRTFREISYLRQFSHKNIIKMKSILKSQNEKDVYLVFQYMEVDLHRVIREDILKEKHKKYIVFQVAKAIQYLHGAELIHRDLKPSNILLNEECFIKLCDFGLVRSTLEGPGKEELIMTEYVATRWYRAPELLLGWNRYSKAIDIWSFGCLIGEMFKGKPLFPGGSTLDQLEKVIGWTGYPSKRDMDTIKGSDGDTLLSTLKISKNKPAMKQEWYINLDPDLKDLIGKMLQFNPSKRFIIEDVLSHPYLSMFQNVNNEYRPKKPIYLEINDSIKLSVKAYRQRIWKFCNPIRPESPINLVKRSEDLGYMSKSSIKRRSLKTGVKQQKYLNISKTLYLKNKKAGNFKSSVISPPMIIKQTKTPSRQRRFTQQQTHSKQKITSYDHYIKHRYMNNHSTDLKQKSLGNSSKILNQQQFQPKRKSISTIKRRINCSQYRKGNLILF